MKLSCDCNGYGSSCNVNMLPNYECKCDDSTKTAGSQVLLIQINKIKS